MIIRRCVWTLKTENASFSLRRPVRTENSSMKNAYTEQDQTSNPDINVVPGPGVQKVF